MECISSISYQRFHKDKLGDGRRRSVDGRSAHSQEGHHSVRGAIIEGKVMGDALERNLSAFFGAESMVMFQLINIEACRVRLHYAT